MEIVDVVKELKHEQLFLLYQHFSRFLSA